MASRVIDYSRLMSEKFLENPVWSQLADAISELFEVEIHQPRRLLANIRNVHALERVAKGFALRTMSVDVTANYLSSVDLDKALDSTPEFYRQRSAADNFIKYIGFITGVRLDMTGLYTEDYVNFYSEALGPMIDEGGNWYATTHIALEFLGDGNLADDEIIEQLFLEYAPIQYVLYYILEKFNLGSTTLTMACGLAEGLEHKILKPSPPSASLYVVGADTTVEKTQLTLDYPQDLAYLGGAMLDVEHYRFTH